MVACGGIGTYEAVWAAILLIIFHAVAKSLLFLGVGTVEHQVHSRDIEDMAGLITNMPKVGLMMLIGMAGMFLAPFGMLISKWATLRAFIDAPGGVVFVLLVAFGSAVTVFFWAKWMGLLIARPNRGENIESRVPKDELAVLGLLAGLVVAVSVLFPWISTYLLEPYIYALYGQVAPARPVQHRHHAPDDGDRDPPPGLAPLLPEGPARPQALHGRTAHDRRHALCRLARDRARDGPPQLLPRGPLQRAADLPGSASRSRWC